MIQVFFYRVRQKKPSNTNISKENLEFHRLEVGEPFGGEISIQQIVAVCNRGHLAYFKVLPKYGHGEIVDYRKFTQNISDRDLVSQI